jgi:hypothetical protein
VVAEYNSAVETLEDYVLRRVAHLRNINSEAFAQRQRIRAIMNGGQDGLRALLGDDIKIKDRDIPTANLVLSNADRLGQDLQDVPLLRVDPPANKETDTEKRSAEKRRRIVTSYDERDKLELLLPQAGRWLPGYGFTPWVITEKVDYDGNRYPVKQLRNPLNTWPGWWGPGQQPAEVAFTTQVPREDLARLYPHHADTITNPHKYKRSQTGGVILTAQSNTWEGSNGDIEVIEYVDHRGTFVCAPSVSKVLDFIPNPIRSGPPFYISKRFAFDKLVGQFDHTLGLMVQMAKLNVLSVIAASDSVFRETNVIGDIINQQYERGRNAVNYFTPGTRVERPGADVAFQVFQQIDRLERQLRITQNYPVSSDGISPMSYTTGAGVQELGAAASKNAKEYQKILRHTLEALDFKQLEWDEAMYPDDEKPLECTIGGETTVETYTPRKHIKGKYRTRRVFGVMAGWDEPNKIISGLQLMQANIIDRETMQENIDGLENVPKVNARIEQQDAVDRLYELLSQEALAGDPKAKAVLVEIAMGGDREKALQKYYRPEGEGETPDEAELMAAMGGMPQGPPQGELGPPPDVQTAMAMLGTGGAEAGIQSVGRF